MGRLDTLGGELREFLMTDVRGLISIGLGWVRLGWVWVWVCYVIDGCA